MRMRLRPGCLVLEAVVLAVAMIANMVMSLLG